MVHQCNFSWHREEQLHAINSRAGQSCQDGSLTAETALDSLGHLRASNGLPAPFTRQSRVHCKCSGMKKHTSVPDPHPCIHHPLNYFYSFLCIHGAVLQPWVTGHTGLYLVSLFSEGFVAVLLFSRPVGVTGWRCLILKGIMFFARGKERIIIGFDC